MGAGRAGAQLQQIAELVGDPEAAAGPGARGGADAAGERLPQPALVANLEQQGVGLAPDRRRAVAAAVDDAVEGELAGGEDEVGAAVGAEAGLGRFDAAGGADRVQRLAVELELARAQRRRRQ